MNKTWASAIHLVFNLGLIAAIVLPVITSYFVISQLLGEYPGLEVFFASVAGLVFGFLIGQIIEITDTTRRMIESRLLRFRFVFNLRDG